ncbi:phosphoglycerate mutase family protein [Phlyctema vagabunda]|uniref:Phosphoglycerate mutase family protein n=1 Tax=Phlyctema vagabunda TaxID=108571 RepID=A0ABR4PMF9_9HELO
MAYGSSFHKPREDSALQTPKFLLSSRRRARGLLSIKVIIPVLFLATVVVALIVSMGEATAPKHLRYTTVTGFFKQDDPATDSATFDYTKENFGLINRSYDTDSVFDDSAQKTQWQRFERYVSHLNEETSKDVHYKVLYLGRHGEGYHNVAEAFYGTKAWDCYWSLQNGNETSTWADAHLTSLGIAQARTNQAFWNQQIQRQKMQTPESYYTSPLTRCLQTANETFSGLPLSRDSPFTPTIKELFREVIGVHTCDRRSTRSYIAALFPDWRFEDGFQEDDQLWSPELRETGPAHDVRSRQVLDDVFTTDAKALISVTAHSGAIASLLRVLGHRVYKLGTGQIIPVFVKAEMVDGELPDPGDTEWEKPETCEKPPALV